jgi:alcohol dehydrogenase
MLTGDSILQSIVGSQVRLCIGRGSLNRLGELAKSLGATRVLLVTDQHIHAAGHAPRGADSLRNANIEVTTFTGAEENPTTQHVEAGLAVAREHNIDFIVGLGGGSSMDCAKGINFLYTNGGQMRDFWGVNKATKPMLPLIAIPTTAGTGSEAQSFALISDPETHEKMACGDTKALPKIAILDADLLATCPQSVAAATGIDALSHAIETAACTKRNETSRKLSKQAFDKIRDSLPAMLAPSENLETRTSKLETLLLGAHLAGAAIQNSMLGAAHACANPLTAKYNITHGIAVGLMLPHVIAYNTQQENFYGDLDPNPQYLIATVQHLLTLASIPHSLREFTIPKSDLPALAEKAALQWTSTFNPRPVKAPELLEIYTRAWNYFPIPITW